MTIRLTYQNSRLTERNGPENSYTPFRLSFFRTNNASLGIASRLMPKALESKCLHFEGSTNPAGMENFDIYKHTPAWKH